MSGQEWSRRRFLSSTTVGAAAVTVGGVLGGSGLGAAALDSRGPKFPAPPRAQKNVHAVGYSDLGGRNNAFKMAIQKVGDRWYLYCAHFWDSGWSILDVTDPKNPRMANFVAWPGKPDTTQVEIAEGKMITSLEPSRWRTSTGFDHGVAIWDVADDPVNPRLLGRFETGEDGTHRNFYQGGRYVHLSANMPGYSEQIYVIIDIADPTHPTEVGRWWMDGQHSAGGETPEPGVSLHGPPYVVGKLAYLPYGSAGMIILDISDMSRPQLVSQLDFSPPFNGGITAHNVVPLVSRGLALVSSEDTTEGCNAALDYAGVVDISDPAKPVLLSTFPIPKPPPGSEVEDFCEYNARFGPHNFNYHYHSPYTNHSETIAYATWFVAGLRVFNIANPRLPEEVGYFLPPHPDQRAGPLPQGELHAQTEDVLVDSRGYCYITHKNQGVWVLRYTGAGQ